MTAVIVIERIGNFWKIQLPQLNQFFDALNFEVDQIFLDGYAFLFTEQFT